MQSTGSQRPKGHWSESLRQQVSKQLSHHWQWCWYYPADCSTMLSFNRCRKRVVLCWSVAMVTPCVHAVIDGSGSGQSPASSIADCPFSVSMVDRSNFTMWSAITEVSVCESSTSSKWVRYYDSIRYTYSSSKEVRVCESSTGSKEIKVCESNTGSKVPWVCVVCESSTNSKESQSLHVYNKII